MKIIKFFLYFFLILFIFFFVAASIYVRIYGKSLVEGALNTALKRNVVLGEVSYRFPLGLRARNVYIAKSLQGGEFLRIKKIVAQLSPGGIYQGRFAFKTVVLIEPSLVIEGKKKTENTLKEQALRQGVVVVPAQPDLPKKEGDIFVAKDQREKAPTEIFIHRLITDQGRLRYVEGLTEEGFSFNLEDVQLKAKKLIFPVKEGRSEFKMSARLIKEGNPLSGSHVKSAGWVDVIKKDMKATVEVVETNGTVGLMAEVVSKNNDMEVAGEVKMRNLFRGIDQKGSSDASAVNDLVRNTLSSVGVEIGAKFSFKTKMDDFRTGTISFSGNVMRK